MATETSTPTAPCLKVVDDVTPVRGMNNEVKQSLVGFKGLLEWRSPLPSVLFPASPPSPPSARFLTRRAEEGRPSNLKNRSIG